LQEYYTSGLEPNFENFQKCLYVTDIPDPDLIIRTSGEQRISDFLLWQLSYSEFYFTDVYWPDFGLEELEKAIKEYNKRQRRFGVGA
jgi:undecaprenyl diphosphate synthase